MTALHLSCRWPAGLSILLSAGAGALIDEPCWSRCDTYYTAVDFATSLCCEEAVALLFDAGCSWSGFHDAPISTVSLGCVRVVASKLAHRRRYLMRLAEETLTESQISAISRGTGVLDVDAAYVVRLLVSAGVDLPTYLAVPDTYETIYLSGSLDITHFPVFYDHGFHDSDHAAATSHAPIQAARLDVYDKRSRGTVDKDLLAPGLWKWLGNHGFLDLGDCPVLSTGTNASATAYHILAAGLTFAGADSPLWRLYLVPSLDPMQTAKRDIFTHREVDNCKCACSSSGCLPLTCSLKAAAMCGWDSGIWLWEALWDDMAGELLRFLTFEALEITHTCCVYHAGQLLYIPSRNGEGMENMALAAFRGDVEEIHEEEE